MEIIITKWALNSYLELKHNNYFTQDEFKKIIRPDVLKLKYYPKDEKFNLQQFWCIVKDGNSVITDGFKMKWDSLGNSNNEIRLLVGIINNTIHLCEAYQKKNSNYEHRMYKRFKVHLDKVRQNEFIEVGRFV